MNHLLYSAHRWRDMGIGTLPLMGRSKLPDGAALWDVGLSGWAPLQTVLPARGWLDRWWGNGSQRNLGVICGWQGLTVIDFDDLGAYSEWAQWAHEMGGSAEAASCSYSVLTQRPGVHVYVFVDLPASCGKGGAKVDVKARGGYVAGAGSVHPSGGVYTALNPGATIVRVSRLADVLPHTTYTESTAVERITPAPLPAISDDPWHTANNARALGSDPLHRVLDRVKAADLVGEVHPSGAGWGIALCPLHDDHSPSLAVNLRTGDVKCLAGCAGGRWLDSVGLTAAMYGVTMRDAVWLLLDR